MEGPGDDNVTLRHYFELPDLKGKDLGEELYRKPPWAISRQKNGAWIYRGISPNPDDPELHRVAVFNPDHTHGTIYSLPRDAERIRSDGWHSLSLFPTDQILLARVLADRQGCYLHSSGAILDGQGLLFVGHSQAGKSTISKMLTDRDLTGFGNLSGLIEVLCDDRNIVRRQPEEFWVYGTWSHGEWPVVSASSAPLRAILFLEKSPENRLLPLDDRQEIVRRLLTCLIKPFVTADWWEKVLDLVEQMARELPYYVLRFDKSGGVVEVLRELVKRET